MRRLLFMAVISALSLPYGIAQRGGGRGGQGAPQPPPAPPPAGLECFEDLPTPEFPKAALQAKVDGTVWVNFDVSPQGAPEGIETKVVSAWADGAKLLTPPSEAAVHAAKLKADCAGKKVMVVFRYELHGEPTANPKVSSHKEPSYLVWIESQPMSTTSGGGK
jgi:Gram-negative bacterial TonB protein C-terminal